MFFKKNSPAQSERTIFSERDSATLPLSASAKYLSASKYAFNFTPPLATQGGFQTT